MKTPKLAICIPTYNEADNIAELVKAASRWGSVYVDDGGSTDGTQELAYKAGATVLYRPTGRGALGWLLTTEQRMIFGDATHVVTMDAGGSHPPACLERFADWAKVAPNALILGVRQLDYQAPRTLLSLAGAVLMGLPDATCGFRCYPVELLKQLPEMHNRSGFTFHFVALGLLRQALPDLAMRLRWVPVPYKLIGRTSLNWRAAALAARAFIELKLGRVPSC